MSEKWFICREDFVYRRDVWVHAKSHYQARRKVIKTAAAEGWYLGLHDVRAREDKSGEWPKEEQVLQ